MDVGVGVALAVGGSVKPLDAGGGAEFEQAASVNMRDASAAMREMDDGMAGGIISDKKAHAGRLSQTIASFSSTPNPGASGGSV